MIADERRAAILDMVRARGVVSLRELATKTETSEMTVRRDLRALEERGLLERTYGGASMPGRLVHEQSYRQKSRIAAAEKAAIADLAVGLVQEGDAIAIGAGSTTEEFARRLTGFQDLTVVTNSLLVAQALAASRIEVVVTGGSLRGSTFALIGTAAEGSLAGFHVHRAFLSGNGLTPARGLSTPNMQVASTDRAIAAAAAEVVVLADHTKIGEDTMCQTVATADITHLVTDDQCDPAALRAFAEAGTVLHIAETRAAAVGDRA
jgi:DeoR/GlpR family transcriptional regulator of sugar metabolism